MPATQCESGNTGGRNNPGRHSQAEDVTGVIHIALGTTGSNPHGLVDRINPDPVHQGEIDHQPIVATPQPRSIVGAAAYRREKLVLPAKADRRDHIGNIGAARDQQRPLIDHRVI